MDLQLSLISFENSSSLAYLAMFRKYFYMYGKYFLFCAQVLLIIGSEISCNVKTDNCSFFTPFLCGYKIKHKKIVILRSAHIYKKAKERFVWKNFFFFVRFAVKRSLSVLMKRVVYYLLVNFLVRWMSGKYYVLVTLF